MVGRSPDEAPQGLDSVADLFRSQYEAMVRLAFLLTGDRSISEDLVQDSFTRLQRRWAQVEDPPAYLRVAVVNACRGHHRRRGRERAHFADLLHDPVSPETPMMLDALAKLPYRQRAALVLRYWEDRPERDIAEVLGCRPATVRSHIRRGLASLRQVIVR